MWADPVQPVWWHRTRALLVLGVIGGSVVLTKPYPWTGVGTATAILTVAYILARIPWIFQWPDGHLLTATLWATAAIGTVLSFLDPTSGAVAFAAFPVANAIVRWNLPASIAFAVGMSVVYDFGHLALGHSAVVLAVGPAAFAGAVLLGLVRRQGLELVAQAQSAREEHARSAALDERARVAREIHDVLAHSLGALTVQLETADALLESGRTEQARTSVLRAGQLAREGLTETRRAIEALRGGTLPLPDLLPALANSYQADFGAVATVSLDGVPRDLRPDVALALYRTAQEAITNVRKHAPGAAVEVELHYGPRAVELVITNDGGGGEHRPLADTGGGYGLTGLRERAELAGGTITAGPHDHGWRVDVRIPE